MNPKPAVIDRWRKFFRGADGNIFDVLEYAILVAASDCPKEFKIRRDDIAQKLFACRFIRCIECESVEEAEPAEETDGDGASEVCRLKETKVNRMSDDNERNPKSNYSYDEAEALTEEIEEESQIVSEVFRIKAVLEKHDESEAFLLESLRRLKLMALSVETLKVTEIGRVVSMLRKHASKEIRNLAKTLISFWRDMADEWVRITATVTGDSPDSVNPSTVDDEEGLPSPPLDEEAFLAPPHNSIELSQFFDGMDDDGNLMNGGDRDNVQKNGRREDVRNNASTQKMNVPEVNVVRKTIVKGVDSHSTACNSASEKPPKPLLDDKLVFKPRAQQRPMSVQVPTLAPPLDKSTSTDDMSVRKKLEVAKRKLHERYQEAENAKKQRTIQVMELQDLPKQGLTHRQSNFKPGFHNRQWNNSNMRR